MAKVCFCRICWNTKEWQHPSGDAAKLELKSYVADRGFGHEEWLLNFGWMVGDYHYGFLQPLHTKYPPKVTYSMEIVLHTMTPVGKFIVAHIKNCERLTQEMATAAYQVYQRNGWLDEMADDLRRINVDPKPVLNVTSPFSILNVRFKLQDLMSFDPLLAIPATHPIARFHRYKPFYSEKLFDSGELRILPEKPARQFSFKSGKSKSTQRRVRAAQNGVSFDPAHDRFQNTLYELLQDQYGSQNVGYEVDGVVDLVVKHDEANFTFYEIKMEATAKRCIRLAVGQLLEYAHWPNQRKAYRLIVVGKVIPSEAEQSYLIHLRELYDLPVFYQYYDTTNNSLSKEY